jgi:Zn-dependent protease with chaperone function
MYELLGICLILAALLALNTLAAGLASLLWRLLAPIVRDWPAAARAQLIFLLRVLPGLLALGCVLLVLLPAYIAYEPRHATEAVSLKLAVLALLSAAGLLLALWRGAATHWATRRLLGNWRAAAQPLQLGQNTLPTYRLQHPFPIIAVVGVRRPRLFIAEQLLSELTTEELAAAVAHETGHLAARDNGKRLLLRACRDLLTLIPCGRALDRAWAEAAEEAADEFAARRQPTAALALAQALVKIARLAPPGVAPAFRESLTANASLLGTEPNLLARRVARLLQLAENEQPSAEGVLRLLSLAQVCSFGLLGGAFLSLFNNEAALLTTHRLLEMVVRGLQ